MPIYIIVIGWLATATNIIGYSFQTTKTLTNKSVKTLAINTFVLNFVGGYLWFINAILTKSMQASVSGVVVLTAIIPIFHMAIFNKGENAPLWKKVLFNTGMFSLVWGGFVISVVNIEGVINLELNDIAKLCIGLVAGCFTSYMFLPQFVKNIKTGNIKDLSFSLILLSFISQVFWLVYWLGRALYGDPIGDYMAGTIFSVLTASLLFAMTIHMFLLKLRAREFNSSMKKNMFEDQEI